MPAYSFQKRWVPKIISGEKHSTIRRPRKKRQTRLGDTIFLYVGMRTKNCQRIMKTTCVRVRPIYFDRSPTRGKEVSIGIVRLNEDELRQLCTQEGFESVSEFFDWFESRYGISNREPLELIEW